MNIALNKMIVISSLILFTISPTMAADNVKVGKATHFVPLTKDKPYIHVVHDGRSVKIQRVQDPEYQLQGYFAKTARKCPPFCIQAITPDSRVAGIGEVELFDFIETKLRDGKGVLIDARTPSWFKKATIPGSVSYPFTLLSKAPGDPELDEVLEKFGARQRGVSSFIDGLMEDWDMVDMTYKTDDWDFNGAKDLVIWCNGPACGQSPRAIRGLLAAGYPGDKIKYYRGGMQMWQLWGLTTVKPK